MELRGRQRGDVDAPESGWRRLEDGEHRGTDDAGMGDRHRVTVIGHAVEPRSDRASSAICDSTPWGADSGSDNHAATASASGAAPRSCWYFGDIDAGGLLAAKLAERRAVEVGFARVEPARGLYRAALAFDGAAGAKRASADLAEWTASWIGGVLGEEVAHAATLGDRIVQEHVGAELLSGMGLDEWFGSAAGQ